METKTCILIKCWSLLQNNTFLTTHLNRYKMHKKIKYFIGLLSTVLLLVIGVSCENEDDFTIIPDAKGAPQITSLTPDLSDIGTTIVLTGTNFSRLASNNRLTFSGDVTAVPSAATDSTLTVTVPSGAITGSISLSLAQFTAQSPVFTVVSAPIILSLNSTSGLVGDTIIISGENFSNVASENMVVFNGITAQVTASTETEISVIVPDGATTGPLTVTVFGQSDESSDNFVLRPVISSFTPLSGLPGAIITITGINFSTNFNNNAISFNGQPAEVVSATATSIVVLVPADASTGTIELEVFGETTTSANDFTFIAPPEVTLEILISDENDDVEQSIETGTMELASSDLELAEYDTTGTPDLGVQIIGLRFNTIEIPAGAMILEASVQFTADDDGTDEAQLLIFGENVGNAAPYEDVAFNVSNRVLTSQSAFWDIPAWPSSGLSGDDQKTVDLSGIVQEIINRGDWVSGNSLNIIMRPTGSSVNETSSTGGREAEAGVGSDSAKLIIKFQM